MGALKFKLKFKMLDDFDYATFDDAVNDVGFTPKQLAERWGTTEGTLSNLRLRRLGPSWTTPTGEKKVVYMLSEILRCERDHKIETRTLK
jgi:hypothetical protein